MATISKGILGGFSGKVGTIVGTSWRGKDIIRSRPKATKRMPTENQLLQQMKFSLAISFLQPLKSIQSRFFGMKIGVRSRVNLAVSYTIREAIQVVNHLPELIYSKVLITKGELTGFQNVSLVLQAGGVLHLEWEDNNAQGNASPNDVVSIVCYSKNLKMFEIYEDVVMRSDMMVDVTLPSYCIGEVTEVWAYLHNEKQTMAGNSFYLGEHSIV